MGLDSVELVMSFEDEFEIEIPNSVAEKMITPGDVTDFVCAEFKRLGRKCDPLDIFLRVRKRTVEITNVDPDRITRSTKFVDDLGID